jgi:glutamate transport system permease protein
MSQTRLVSTNYANTIAAYTIAALLFIVVNFLLTYLAGLLEQRIRRGKRTPGTVVVANHNDGTDPSAGPAMAAAGASVTPGGGGGGA